MKRMDMQTAYAGYGARKVWHKEDRMRLSLPPASPPVRAVSAAPPATSGIRPGR